MSESVSHLDELRALRDRALAARTEGKWDEMGAANSAAMNFEEDFGPTRVLALLNYALELAEAAMALSSTADSAELKFCPCCARLESE